MKTPVTTTDKKNLFLLASHLLQITSTASDPELGFTIISCFISHDSNPSVSSEYTLIETVCPTDASVTYYPQFPVHPTKMDKKTFSFIFNSTFKVSLLFLHCEMSLCSKSSQRNLNLPQVCRIIFPKEPLLCFFFLVSQSITSVCLSSRACRRQSLLRLTCNIQCQVCPQT